MSNSGKRNGKPLIRETDQNREWLRTLKFTLFSLSAGAIQIGTWALFLYVFHWEPWVAYMVSLVLSVIWNFTFNRKYTFRSDYDIKRAMLLTLLFYLVFTPASTWWTFALTGQNQITNTTVEGKALVDPLLVQIGTMLINFVTEFLWQRFVIYRNKLDTTVAGKDGGQKGQA